MSGDLREHLPALLAAEAVLFGAMLAVWRLAATRRTRMAPLLAAALAFRVIAACAPPSLSDDVYRYVWDGRVQLHGFHPYLHAPADPALDALRDADWVRINHPELHTIYPPLAEGLFLALAAVDAGPLGVKLTLGIADFAVVLSLCALLRTLGLPADRAILYAWNPLAVLETAASGHVEPLGVGLVVLGAAWIAGRRPGLSALALAGAVQAKLLPLVLVPGWSRRWRLREVALFAVTLCAIGLPYALAGPAFGGGLADFAERWEANPSVYGLLERGLAAVDSGVALEPPISAARRAIGAEWIPWSVLYEWVWPARLARVVCALLLVAWVAWLAFRPRLDAARETFLVLCGALLLSPTLHPWYVLWVLPFAAAYASLPWLGFSVLVSLSYLGGAAGPPAWVPWVEYGGLCGLALVEAAARRRYPGPGGSR